MCSAVMDEPEWVLDLAYWGERCPWVPFMLLDPVLALAGLGLPHAAPTPAHPRLECSGDKVHGPALHHGLVLCYPDVEVGYAVPTVF